jgi:hypothetical protein
MARSYKSELSSGTYGVRGRCFKGMSQTWQKQMRKVSTSRPKKSAKKAVRSTASRRQARKKSTSPTVATAAKHVELPYVVAPPTQVVPPFMLWPALPIAMMRMWLGPREKTAGR